jgi:hypothetical protein
MFNQRGIPHSQTAAAQVFWGAQGPLIYPKVTGLRTHLRHISPKPLTNTYDPVIRSILSPDFRQEKIPYESESPDPCFLGAAGKIAHCLKAVVNTHGFL